MHYSALKQFSVLKGQTVHCHKRPTRKCTGLLLDCLIYEIFNLRSVAEERFYSVSGLMSLTTAHEESSPFLLEIAVYYILPSLPGCFLYT